ncbi:MAG: proton-conducting transporter membrane subunit [Limisphaerales bacterium]
MTESSPAILSFTLVLPWVAAVVVPLLRTPTAVSRFCVAFLGSLLVVAILAISLSEGGPAVSTSNTAARVSGRTFAIDDASAPILPTLILLHLLTFLGTAKSRVTASHCVRILLSTFAGLAIVTCQDPWVLTLLLILSTLLPYSDLKAHGQPTRGFAIHMGVFVALLGLGQMIAATTGSIWGFGLVGAALVLRAGAVPFHGWVPRLFEKASFAAASLYVLPLIEVAAAIRLLTPRAPTALLDVASIACLITAVYSGAMAIVQSDFRRFFAHVCLSQTSLVLFGVMLHTETALTAALSLWVSTPLALAGLGFSLRAIEARFGRLSLDRHHGHYEQVPGLAITFLIAGLASIGFPGTVGFLPMELLFSGSSEQGLAVSGALAVVAMLNGIAILRAYFAIFTGRRPASSVSLAVTRLERAGILVIALVIFAGAWLPPSIVASRHRVAEQLLDGASHRAAR